MKVTKVKKTIFTLSMLSFLLSQAKSQYCHLNRFINTVNCTAMDTRFLPLIRSSIPPLDNEKHKGQAGRIGIIGGSLEYTGAPYFSGISALKVGADLVHIFCVESAATVIKSYSPELIVHPLLDHKDATKLISPWLDRLHAIVIGPGLGRDINVLNVVTRLIEICKQKHKPLVIDADGLFLITENLSVIKNYPGPGVILTPNKIEFERLQTKIDGSMKGDFDVKKLGEYVTVLRKGSEDELFSLAADWQWKSGVGGSGRRSGGQGDILSGAIATFFQWTLQNEENIVTKDNKALAAASIACYAGTRLVRLCNQEAFKCKHRSMLASDMIDHISEVFINLFE